MIMHWLTFALALESLQPAENKGREFDEWWQKSAKSLKMGEACDLRGSKTGAVPALGATLRSQRLPP